MRNNTLAVVISSLLLGTAAAHAGEVADAAAPEVQAQSQTDATLESSSGSTEATSEATATQDADQATQSTDHGTGSPASANPEVGEPRSNVDEHATSGSYYPYSAGTVGDDPAAPHDTSVPMGSVGEGSSGTDRWDAADADRDTYLSKDELNAVAPTLSANFGDMDSDGDGKITRDEFRTWQQSNQARMDADQGAPATGESATPVAPDAATPGEMSEEAATTSTAPEAEVGQ